MTRGLYLILINVALVFLCAECKTEKPKDEFQFYYYPQKNVYYNPRKREFWYSLNGNKSWTNYSNVSGLEPAALGKKVVINTVDSNGYRDNDNHRKLYSGKLYHIVAIGQAFAVAGTEVTEKATTAVKRKPNVANRSRSSKHKNPIGKFINKIFGGHGKK